MRTCLVLAILGAVLLSGIGGCINVPKGPYVDVDLGNGDGSTPAATGSSVNEFRALLKRARSDGIITDNQYQRLTERVEDELKK